MTLAVRTGSCLIDEPLAVEVGQLTPGTPVTLTASCVDPEGCAFTSRVEFLADARGHVSSASQAPVAGSFRGVDPFGPWWSMSSVPERAFAHGLRPIPTIIEAEADGRALGRFEVSRRRVAPDIGTRVIREGGLVGTLFSRQSAPAAGVMVLGGSEGGSSHAEEIATFLANHGFTALALAYFGMDGLPAQLVDIPVEYIESAASWLLHRPEVVGDGIGLVGTSRGGELALLVASGCSLIRAVVGIAASPVLWPGRSERSDLVAAWSRNAVPLPFATPQLKAIARQRDVWWLEPAFRQALDADTNIAPALVPLHAVRASVLLISGGDDGLWPSTQLAELALRALRSGPTGPTCHHLAYPAAGHAVARALGIPARPVHSAGAEGGPRFALGGSREANAHSARDAWPRIFSFLERHLCDKPAPLAKACANWAPA
jgi:dienelactone hydrolase